MFNDIKEKVDKIDAKISELKKKASFTDEIAELCFLRELLLEQLPYEDTCNTTR